MSPYLDGELPAAERRAVAAHLDQCPACATIIADYQRVGRMIADAIYANDNQRMMAQWYGASLATGATVDDVRDWPDRIRRVTADQVQEAARRWLDKQRSVTGYLVKDTRPEEKRS